MAKELTKKQIAEMGSEQVAEYYNNIVAETKAKKNEAEKILREIENVEKQKNRKKINHARFILADEFIKKNNKEALVLISEIIQNVSERKQEALRLLANEIKKNIKIKKIVITKEWLKDCRCPSSGGYTTAQFEVLKIAGLEGLIFKHGTAQAGWKDIITGQEIDEEFASQFFEYRTKLTEKTMRRKAKEQKQGTFSLFSR